MLNKAKTILTFVFVLMFAVTVATAQDVRPPLTYVVIVDISWSMEDQFPAPVQPVLSDTSKLMDVKRRLSLLAKYLPTGTRVIVTVFDHNVTEVCDLKIDTDSDRQKLTEKFSSIECRKGSTHLWSTALKKIGDAKAIADENPEGRVRVLLYSDGKDEERDSKVDHNTIIETYGESLQSVVTLDWITIGYDLESTVKAKLQESGVVFSRADKPEDIVPLRAGFTLSSNSVQADQSVSLLDDSLGIEIVQRVVDWGDGTPYDYGDKLHHSFAKPGSYKIRYLVKNKLGTKSQSTATVTVTLPSPLKPMIAASQLELLAGDRVRFTDNTAGPVAERKWVHNNQVLSTAKSFQFSATETGSNVVQLVVFDRYGQEALAEKSVVVTAPAGPTAEFRFSIATPSLGEVVTLVNDSSETAIRFEWRRDGELFSSERHPTTRMDHYESCSFELKVWDRFEQKNSVVHEIGVVRPPKPVVSFQMPNTVDPGTTVSAVDNTSGEFDKGEWIVDDELVSTGPILQFRPESGKRHTVRRVVYGPGGTAEASANLSVNPYAAPVASFTVGNLRPFVGDMIVITDTTTGGPVERIRFEVDGIETPFEFDLVQSAKQERSFEIPCVAKGTFAIHQSVFGPGGSDTHTISFAVHTRAVPPRADFLVNRLSGRGSLFVEFSNKPDTSGSRFEFDPGDGSPAVESNDPANFSHKYQPGEWFPSIRAFGRDGENFSPAIWRSPEPIVVHEPLPAWVWNLAWLIPVCFLGLAGTVFASKKIRQVGLNKSRALLSGQLTVCSADNPRQIQRIEFSGDLNEESVELSENTRLSISTACSSGLVSYNVSLIRDGQTVRSTELEGSTDTPIGNYIVSYVP